MIHVYNQSQTSGHLISSETHRSAMSQFLLPLELSSDSVFCSFFLSSLVLFSSYPVASLCKEKKNYFKPSLDLVRQKRLKRREMLELAQHRMIS